MLLDFHRLGGLKWVLVGIGVLVAAFLLLPILFTVALSFGSSQWLVFPPPSWTLRWYQELFADSRWISSTLTSLQCAILVTILSVGLGLLTSFFEGLCLIPIGPVLVILLPLLRVGQDLLCLIELFKFLFHLGLLCAGMEIWMVLAGQASKSFFDIVGRGGSGDAQNVIIIAWGSCHT